jgi:hypothetical protein
MVSAAAGATAMTMESSVERRMAILAIPGMTATIAFRVYKKTESDRKVCDRKRGRYISWDEETHGL